METHKSDHKEGQTTAGANTSPWISTMQPIAYEKLDRNLETDVVVVGGGISGVTIAYCLVRSGLKVVLVEDGNIGSGETGRTTAHLVSALDDRYYNLEKMFGKRKTKLIAESHRRAIDFIEMVIQNEGFECDFERVPGYLFLHPTDKPGSLEKELEAAKRAGLDVTELKDIPGMETQPGPCIRFNNQAQFHPLKYLAGMCNSLVEDGGLIFTGTHASVIDSTGITTTEGYRVSASHVVVATNSPVNNKFLMHLRQYPHRTYVIGARVKKGCVPQALWWDTGDHEYDAKIPPYHYVRTVPLDADYDLIICGGEDHLTGLADADNLPEEDRYKLLETWLRARFPAEDIVYRWSGQVLEPMDSLAYIGRNPLDKTNVYIVTGDSGNGMTHGTIAGMLISDLVTGKENKFEQIYSPSRFKLLKAGNAFVKELMSSMTSYMKKKPRDTEEDWIQTMQPGEGKVVVMEGKEYGAYRDTGNTLHMVSAVCTHLGCTIKWNADEKSWDCPCHGSRFTHKGKVLNGPANTDLEYHKLSDPELFTQAPHTSSSKIMAHEMVSKTGTNPPGHTGGDPILG